MRRSRRCTIHLALLQQPIVPFPSFDLCDLLLHKSISPLLLPNGLDHVFSISTIQSFHHPWQFVTIFLRSLDGRKQWTLEFALLARAIQSILLLRPQLIAQKPQKQVSQRVHRQPLRIVGFSILDKSVVREKVGDAHKVLVQGAVKGERLE